MSDVNEKLTEENLPDTKNQEEFAKELLEQMKNNPNSVKAGELNYVLYWKISCTGLSPELVNQYLQNVEAGISSQLDKYNCISFYEPVMDQPTSLTMINAQTMKYVKI